MRFSAVSGQYGRRSLITPNAAMFPVITAKLAAIYNPFIYALTHPRFKQALRKALPCTLHVGESTFQRPRSCNRAFRARVLYKQARRGDDVGDDDDTPQLVIALSPQRGTSQSVRHAVSSSIQSAVCSSSSSSSGANSQSHGSGDQTAGDHRRRTTERHWRANEHDYRLNRLVNEQSRRLVDEHDSEQARMTCECHSNEQLRNDTSHRRLVALKSPNDDVMRNGCTNTDDFLVKWLCETAKGSKDGKVLVRLKTSQET